MCPQASKRVVRTAGGIGLVLGWQADLRSEKASRSTANGDGGGCQHRSHLRRQRIPKALSGLARKFVGGSGPGGGVAEVQAAGGVQGVFGYAGEGAGGQDRILVAVFAGQVDREAPAGG